MLDKEKPQEVGIDFPFVWMALYCRRCLNLVHTCRGWGLALRAVCNKTSVVVAEKVSSSQQRNFIVATC